MKNILKVASLFILFALIASPATAQNNIVGKWMDINDGDTGIFIFDKEGFASVEINGEKMGGRSFKMDGVMAACMTYEVIPAGNNTYKVNLYIKAVTSDSSIFVTAPGLIQFLTPDKIKFAANFEHSKAGKISSEEMEAIRPKDTNNTDETATMIRVK